MLSIPTGTDEQFVTMFERMARQCAGLILDGIEARVWSMDEEEDDE